MASGWNAAHASALVVETTTARFSFRGPDARRFLNGMLTNNVSSQAVGTMRRNGICDNKGRLLGLLDLWCTAEDTFVAALEGIDRDWFEARYSKYIVFDDVELDDVSADCRAFVIAGPAAASAIPQEALSTPIALSVPAWSVLVPAGVQARFEGATSGAAADLELLRIAAGRPRFPVDVGERDGPHVMGLVGEIVAFDKGCYIGQETIHRIDAMGRVKRHFTAMRVEGDEPVAIGADVWVGERKVGAVSSSAMVPDLGCIALGVLKEPGSEPGQALQVDGRSAMAVALPEAQHE